MWNSAVDAQLERDLELPSDNIQDVTKNMFVFTRTNSPEAASRLAITSDHIWYEEELKLAGVRDLMARREQNESAQADTV